MYQSVILCSLSSYCCNLKEILFTLHNYQFSLSPILPRTYGDFCTMFLYKSVISVSRYIFIVLTFFPFTSWIILPICLKSQLLFFSSVTSFHCRFSQEISYTLLSKSNPWVYIKVTIVM